MRTQRRITRLRILLDKLKVKQFEVGLDAPEKEKLRNLSKMLFSPKSYSKNANGTTLSSQ